MDTTEQALPAASAKGHEDLSLVALLLANLLPLAEVLWFGWDLLSVLLSCIWRCSRVPPCWRGLTPER